MTGQAAVEFFAYAGFFLMFFAFSTLYFANQQQGEMRLRETQLAKEVGSQYADFVNFAVAAGDGFEGNFTVAKTIGGSEYRARFGSDGFVYLNWTNTKGDFVYVYPMSTRDLDVAQGAPAYITKESLPKITYIDIDESRGKITLINSKGTVLINQS